MAIERNELFSVDRLVINSTTYSSATKILTIDGSNEVGYIDSSSISGSQSLITISYSTAYTYATSSLLIPGQKYKITDAASSMYGGTEVLLTAFDASKFEEIGTGKFYNPIYSTASGKGIYNSLIDIGINTQSGQFIQGEYINTLGDVGYINAIIGPTGSVLRVTRISGTWSGNTTIQGSQSSSVATISIISSLPTYATGSSVIWGGKKWINKNGKRGNAPTDYTLDDKWMFVTFSSSDYNVVYDYIKYDLNSNSIYYREDRVGNKIYDVKNFQWGGTYVTNNIGYSGYIYNILNFRYGFYNNTNIGHIYNNTNIGNIYDNSNKGGIYNNSNNGGIYNNSNNGLIANNSSFGAIVNNSSFGDIWSNSNYGNTYNNSNIGHIRYNTNYGGIFHNTNNGSIDSNSSGGNISDPVVNK